MSYRDELEAAHARIEALLRQLASTQPARESDALRAMSEELREARQLLATHESLTAHTRASSEAHVASVNAVRAAETARAEALLEATKQAAEAHLRDAVQERQQAEQRLEELAGLSRAAALRTYQERLATVTAERATLAGDITMATTEPSADASMEEQVRFTIAKKAAAMKQRRDAQLAEHEERLARVCARLAQAPQE
mgnify:CR=1 FL=1|jgi:hypothetical protein